MTISSSVARIRTEADSRVFTPPSQNPHLAKMATSVIWAEAFSYLSLEELCLGVVHSCKDLRKYSAQALLLIFRNSVYGTRSFQRSAHAFHALRGENLTTDQLISKYWANKKTIDLDGCSLTLNPAGELDFQAMCAHDSAITSLRIRNGLEYALIGRSARLALASPNLTQCELIGASPSLSFLEALASRSALNSFKFFEPAMSPFVALMEYNFLLGNVEFYLKYQTAILKLLDMRTFESFHHNGWQLTASTLQSIAARQPQIKDLALGYSGNNIFPGQPNGIFAALDYAALEQELITTLKNTKQLRSLSLRQNWATYSASPHSLSCKHFVSDRTLETLAQSCDDLRELRLFNCSNITGKGIANLAKCCKHLETLSLVQEWYNIWLPQYIFYDAIDDKALQALAIHASQLKKLTIRSRSITDKGVACVAACQKLEILDLNSCMQVTARCMQAFQSFIPPNLQYIDLRKTSDSTTYLGAGNMASSLLELLPRLPAAFKLLMDTGTFSIEREKRENRLAFTYALS